MSKKYFIGNVGRTVQDTKFVYKEINKCPKDAPNVVYILLDDMGFAALGCYGSDINTPNIDRLANEGLRYNNFHTTAVCSATRASLLTGANHHKVGIASLVDWKSGAQNGIGHIDPSYGTLAEILKEYDYSTFACGKWHLTDVYTSAGPYDTWPLGKGFERYYGFLNPGCDQYHPPLIQDNSLVEQPKAAEEGYHVSEDITDHAINYIFNQKNTFPDKPFFLYLAYGATHAPHHAPKDYIDKYKGKFDAGWDILRKKWFDRQKELGIIPKKAELTDRAPYVDAWDTLTDEQKIVFARHMEVYAGFLEHTDTQIGRLLDYLESINQLDNTVIIFLSDNGASAEGGREGRFNTYRGGDIVTKYNETSIAMKHLEDIGGPLSQPHYPSGWANLCNTPFQWYKIWAHEGGVKDPLIIRYPKLIQNGGEIRSQYHHVSDITPTVLDIIGIEKPDYIKGIKQNAFTGISMKYTFNDALAKDKKHTQYYEVLGNRGIYKDGWKAVVNHAFSTSYDEDVWELYHVEDDYSEKYDVADLYPEKLRELQEEFFLEAGRNNVFPMMMGSPHASRENWWKVSGKVVNPEKKWHFLNIFQAYRVSSDVRLLDSSYYVSFDIEISKNDEGVLLANGDRFGGNTFYIKDNKLHFGYNANCERYFDITSDYKLSEGRIKVAYLFNRISLDNAEVTLFVDGAPINTGHIDMFYYLAVGGVTIRSNPFTEVVPEYKAPFIFSGKIHEVYINSYASDEDVTYQVNKVLNIE